MATPIYSVKAYEFLDTTNYGVGNLVADFELQKNMGYAEYVNDVGEAFFTLSQKDSKIALLDDLVDQGGHMQIYRDTDLMWAGWFGETDEANNDAIFYGYSYAAGLFERLTAWEQEFTAAQIDTIFDTLWDVARGVSPSTSGNRMGWMTQGTLEAPVTTSGGGTAIVMNRYTTYYKRILFAFQELAAAAISDTTNRVVWEITPAGALNLWKNRGADLTTMAWHYGDPKLLSYRRQRTPADHRNVIYAVGTSPKDLTLTSTQSDATDISNNGGRREESIYLQWVRDQDELDRIAKLRLARAKRFDSSIALTFAPGALTPFRATGQSYKLTDGVPVVFDNGVTQMAETKLIVGQQVMQYRGQEIVRPLLSDRL